MIVGSKTKYIFAFFFLALMPPCAFADGSFDPYVNQYVNKLISEEKLVFYTECGTKADSELLVIPIGETEGLLLELNDGAVTNLAEFTFNSGKLQIGDTNGGVASRDRIHRQITIMLRRSFQLLSPTDLRAHLTTAPKQGC